ncbi:hypothetical protein TWF106_003454 [Orbilia oligospora]|uniref:ACB domain-containing protein n=1 Tax=Orbilia oligospora TaxID=2813651 RepID=A0A7C8Q6X7_ORBOL|nr:hypothetical protein TWF106_003454 [Orbilia oligospora]
MPPRRPSTSTPTQTPKNPFTLAVTSANSLLTPKIESNPDPLQSIRDSTSLYGFYMQATIGDYRPPFPSASNSSNQKPDIYERTAWLKWMSHKGMSKTEAQKLYVEMVGRLMVEYRVEDGVREDVGA